jgi:hypothetical protein
MKLSLDRFHEKLIFIYLIWYCFLLLLYSFLILWGYLKRILYAVAVNNVAEPQPLINFWHWNNIIKLTNSLVIEHKVINRPTLDKIPSVLFSCEKISTQNEGSS